VRFLFNFFGLLSALSLLLLIASVLTETLSGYKNFVFSGSSLTVNFSGIDRILLGAFIVFLIFAVYFWQKLTGRG
jgi:hypothetical protein